MSEISTTPAVRIERVFDAPVELIWQMWTDPAHLARWYGPEGASIPTATMDVRVGGVRQVCMEATTPNGPMRMWFTGEYREVDPPRRLAYTESLTDADGNVLSPASMRMPPDHPATTEVVVQLDDLDGRTRMVMTHVGIPAGSTGEMGWNMSFDRLTALLATPAT